MDPTQPAPDEPPPPTIRPDGLGGIDPGELLARGLHTPQPSAGAGHWLPPTPEELAALLPQYHIESLLGHGGMGAVYKGIQSELDRPVAIKLLPAEMAAEEQFVVRFRREARTLARLQHPGIVAVYDFGQTSQGHLYFVMEFVDGTDLHHIIHRGGGGDKGGGRAGEPSPSLDPAQALALLSQICDALQYAHSQGVIHRDIKPANILLTTDGRAKLADFGLARPLQEETAQLTGSHVVMGTRDYMAPEQMMGEADHRSDIFALGVTLYEMLTGKRPRGAFEPPSQRVQVDVRLDEVVVRALQEQPERRYQQASEMRTDVDRIRSTPGPKVELGTRKAVRKTRIAIAVLAACVVLTCVVGFLMRKKGSEPDQPQPASASGQVFDLLAITDPAKDMVRLKLPGRLSSEKWSRTADGFIAFDAEGYGGKIVCPIEVSASTYEIEFEVRRLSKHYPGRTSLELAAPNGRQIRLILFSPNDRIIGGREGVAWPLEFSKEGHVFVRVETRNGVGRDRVLILLDDKMITDWRGDLNSQATDSSNQPRIGLPANSPTHIAFFTPGAAYEIRKWTLRVIEGSARALRSLGTQAGTISDTHGAASFTEATNASTSSTTTNSATATKDTPFTNTLGMKFVPVPRTKVLFCIWETRVRDYTAFAAANKVDSSWANMEVDGVSVSREPDYPVVGVSWEDAQAFCNWLTIIEANAGLLVRGAHYRLPSDEEWSRAVGLPAESGATPKERSQAANDEFPWGADFPPVSKVGNYADETRGERFSQRMWIKNYTDGFATTAPVGMFPPNKFGIHDLGGNVWEWCEDFYASDASQRVMRGASWFDLDREKLRSSIRYALPPIRRRDGHGFRCVLAPAPSPAPAAAP